jgi:Mg/Co/Ni transporter MgtE
MYGKGEAVTEMTINLFASGAKKYCLNTNALELKGGKWIHATIVEENDQIAVKKPPAAGKNMAVFKYLDDRGIQKVLHKTDAQTLACALKNAGADIRERIFRNMSKDAARCMKEDMEYMGPIQISVMRAAQNELTAIVNRMVLKDEIRVIDENFI